MYGLLISFSIFISVFLVEKIAKSKKLNIDYIYTGATIIVLCGVVGARLYHVIDYWEIYKSNLPAILQIFHGGLGIYGGIFGGLLGVLICYKYYKVTHRELVVWLDIICCVLPLAQAIGRWGNFFNNELWGKETIFYGVKHPIFLYESLLNLVLFLVLYKTNKSPGFVTGLYLIGYGSIRFMLDFLRDRVWEIHGIGVAQLISVIFVMIGLAILYLSKRYVSRDQKTQ
jgi:phosphatidylglycerol---prolipoprotein diacylglyceryl transferase